MAWYWWVVIVLAYLLSGFGMVYILTRHAKSDEDKSDVASDAFGIFILWPFFLPFLAFMIASRKKKD